GKHVHAGGGRRGRPGRPVGGRGAHLEAHAPALIFALPSLRGAGPPWAGPTLLAAGLALLLGWSATIAAGEIGQLAANGRWQRIVGAGPPPAAAQVPPPAGLARPVDGVDFRLRVPRLGYQAVV